MNALRPAILSLMLAAAVTLNACSSTHTAADSSTSDAPASAAPVGAADAASPGSDAYPDWIAAVVPDYPNRVDQQAITPGLYQIDVPDDLATVAGWYRSHTSGGAWKKSDPDSPDEWFYDGPNGVHIDIQANHYPGNNSAAKATKTMIAFTQKKH
jgi:hypothetical protein